MSGGGSKTREKSTTTTTTDPYLQGLLTQNYNSAQAVANRPYEAYQGNLVAGLNPMQTQAYDQVGQMGNVGNSNLASASNYATQAGNVSPSQVGTGYDPQQVSAQSLANTDLSPYMNPYNDQVIQATMKQLEEQRLRSLVGNAQGATASTGGNPFGGDRIGVQNALTNEYMGNTAASTLAALNAQNFSQAQNAATGDISRGIQTQGMNQSAGLQGAALNQQGEIANQNAGLQASQLQLGAASALSGLSQQELNMALQKAGALETAGAAQQSQEQAQLDAQYQQWLQEWMYPLQQQQIRNESLGLFPVTGTTSSTGSSSTKKKLGLGDYVGMISDLGKTAASFGG